jgi:hypothetical protein
VYVTEQVPETSVHVVALKPPDDAACPENITVPVGVSAFFSPSLSLTVAVQVVGVFCATVEGEQFTVVAALRR